MPSPLLHLAGSKIDKKIGRDVLAVNPTWKKMTATTNRLRQSVFEWLHDENENRFLIVNETSLKRKDLASEGLGMADSDVTWFEFSPRKFQKLSL